MTDKEVTRTLYKQRHLPAQLARARERHRQLAEEAQRYGLADLLTPTDHVLLGRGSGL